MLLRFSDQNFDVAGLSGGLLFITLILSSNRHYLLDFLKKQL